jgi:hypothetical protein
MSRALPDCPSCRHAALMLPLQGAQYVVANHAGSLPATGLSLLPPA